MRPYLMAGLLLLSAMPSWALGLVAVSNNIVSPNGDGINDQIRITVDNPAADVQGRLYDMNGRQVADLVLQASGANATLVWDGRVDGGRAESGVYIYQITGDSKHLSGVVAVAR